MSSSTWKTGSPIRRTGPIGRVTRADVVRQLVIAGVIGAVWLGVVIIAVSVAGTGAENITVNQPDYPPAATAVAAAPTSVVPTTAASPTTAPTVAASPTSSPTRSAPTQAPSQAPTSTATKPAATATTAAAATTAATPTTAAAPTTAPTAASSGGAVSFSGDVKPILDRVCVKCHGGEETKEGLNMTSYDQLMAGSDNGPVITPGDPINSLLIDLITKGKMPKQGPKLLPAQIRTISDWVAAGAKNN